MERAPKVSVAMPAFNHERFIAQAVESALAQTTDFDFEIVIGEDVSTDHTRELLVELARRAPDRIRLILNPRNLGMHANLVNILSSCRGRYIALLEGDDYWTDPSKLQQQADLLDGQSGVAICHHNALMMAEGASEPPRPVHERCPPTLATIDKLMVDSFLTTCTVMFRGGLIDAFPDWYFECGTGDWPLHVLNAQHGHIAYIPKIMAVYRVHPGGAWSSRTNIARLESLIRTAEKMGGSLRPHQRRRLACSVAGWRFDVVRLLREEGRSDEAERYAGEHLAPASYARMSRFYDALEEERAGRRLPALSKLIKAASCGWCRTRIGSADILLAMTRVASPRMYRAMRALWRSRQKR